MVVRNPLRHHGTTVWRATMMPSGLLGAGIEPLVRVTLEPLVRVTRDGDHLSLEVFIRREGCAEDPIPLAADLGKGRERGRQQRLQWRVTKPQPGQQRVYHRGDTEQSSPPASPPGEGRWAER
eukprot:CAMPEP_0181173224 /NCGR_PEP_ID=MMETSP1096-20121128/2883_1 /TAXON_ID=156174 ORGANISM="Chrysochromulina ericina, Strain CCMP281" /NCGR_SAMPLE_ID=MMETSP1096 /ASSEMBLY_ACC=CAM_ASM_000453 /LENGTH=122 /DNA_ID=CAMNT_0023261033 /DNA_START=150 /DNA_END=518 /DNA_ORIENTATION=+